MTNFRVGLFRIIGLVRVDNHRFDINLSFAPLCHGTIYFARRIFSVKNH